MNESKSLKRSFTFTGLSSTLKDIYAPHVPQSSANTSSGKEPQTAPQSFP